MLLFYVLLPGYLPFDELYLTMLYNKTRATIMKTIFYDYL
jgi:hypothetical protein